MALFPPILVSSLAGERLPEVSPVGGFVEIREMSSRV
jgi:hypothetical protein